MKVSRCLSGLQEAARTFTPVILYRAPRVPLHFILELALELGTNNLCVDRCAHRTATQHINLSRRASPRRGLGVACACVSRLSGLAAGPAGVGLGLGASVRAATASRVHGLTASVTRHCVSYIHASTHEAEATRVQRGRSDWWDRTYPDTHSRHKGLTCRAQRIRHHLSLRRSNANGVPWQVERIQNMP